MKHLIVLVSSLLFATVATAFAQQRSPEEMEKLLYESIDKEVEKQSNVLDLEDWQIFRVDSMLTYNYKAMTAEIEKLQKNGFSNSSAYIGVQDKWTEEIYNAYHRILDNEQWEKYLKNGAARAKKSRDKRMQKNQ